MKAAQETVHHVLDTHIMFSQLSDHDKEFLQTQFELRTFAAGTIIAEQDQPMESFIYLQDGKVRLKHTTEGKRVSLGVLERKASLGETALIQEDHWHHQVVAEELTTALVLPAIGVRRMLSGNADMAQLFKKEIGYLLLAQSLRDILGDFPCRATDFVEILHQIGVKNIAAGHVIFEQGQADPRLYHVEKGEVVLVRRTVQGLDVVLDHVYPGALIGEGAALSDRNAEGVQPHTAKAVGDVTVLVIRHAEVEKILAINPSLREQLWQRIDFLQGKERQEIDYRLHAEGVDQRIRLSGVTEAEFKAQQGEIKTFSWVRQRTDSDGVAACLTMICNHYGKGFKLGQIAELGNLSAAGVTPDAVIAGAERLGFDARAYALRFDDIPGMKLPGVVGWEGHKYIVLYRVTDKDVYLVDPAGGPMQLSRQEFETGWTQAEVPGVISEPDRGIFIALNPTARFEPAAPPLSSISHFIRYCLPYKKFFTDALTASFLFSLLGLAFPVFTQMIVDTVVVHKDASFLNLMFAGMILIVLFKTITSVSQKWLLAHTAARVNVRMMSEFYRHLLSLPIGFFSTRNRGEIFAGLQENQKVSRLVVGEALIGVFNFLMLFLYFFMMLGYSVSLTLVAMLFLVFHVGITLYFTPRLRAISQKMYLADANCQSDLMESLNAIESIKATANEYMARVRWEDALTDHVNLGFERQKLALISDHLGQWLALSATVVLLWLGATHVVDGKMTVGELMGFQVLLGVILGSVLHLTALWNRSQDVRVALARIADVLNIKPEQEPVTSAENMPATLPNSLEGRIVFDKVDFSHTSTSGKESFVLKGFELTIEPGQHVALVGAAGCGKSTIAKMILGFNMPLPSGGTCTIDGRDIRELDLSVLRRNMGAVLQDGFLFRGTVAENIALGDPEPNLAQVREAARLAGADDFIQKMAMGFQTLIGEKGVGISGSQRQRICIARAVYRRPRILLLDEATSALDSQTEALVQENMARFLRGRTSITMTSRLTTIINSDLICFIKDGRVAERGTHQELIDPDHLHEKGYQGLYYRFAALPLGLPPLNLSTSGRQGGG
ncbi:MAG: peptidase C39 [Magnetococcales bacterium]|nr:peptidase C39 [Magnetococcales bacterium]